MVILVEQVQLTLWEHSSSSPGFSGVRVARSLVFHAVSSIVGTESVTFSINKVFASLCYNFFFFCEPFKGTALYFMCVCNIHVFT
jgi:hypothetical protein